MIVQGILIGLVAAYGRIEQAWLGQQMIARPIWLCSLVGLVLGDFKTGLIIGGTLELIWMGVVQIGAVPTEVVTGSVVASSLVIANGLGVDEAVTLAIPIGALASIGASFVTTLNSLIVPAADRAVEAGNTKALWWYGISGGAVFAVFYFVVAYVAFVLGSVVVQNVIENIPLWVQAGLRNASGMLPAIGIGMLLMFTLNAQFAGFFFLGFLLAAYFNLNTMAIALIGGTCAYIYFQLKKVEEED